MMDGIAAMAVFLAFFTMIAFCVWIIERRPSSFDDGLDAAERVVRDLRESHQKDTAECDEDCDYVIAWETAEERIRALRGGQ